MGKVCCLRRRKLSPHIDITNTTYLLASSNLDQSRTQDLLWLLWHPRSIPILEANFHLKLDDWHDIALRPLWQTLLNECIEAKEALDFLNALHIIVNLARKFKHFMQVVVGTEDLMVSLHKSFKSNFPVCS